MNFNITADFSRPELPDRKYCAKSASRAVVNLIKKNFRKKNSTQTKQEGWPSPTYYARAANSVNNPIVEGNTVTVMITHPGISLHFRGRSVFPRKGNFLAHPIDPTVAGVWPSEYEGKTKAKLFKLVSSKGNNILAVKDKSSETGFRPLWLLRDRTDIPSDNTVIPSNDALSASATKAVRNAIAPYLH